MFKFFSVLLWGLILTFSYAFQQEFQIYSETDQQGNGLILRSKEPDISLFAPVNLGTHKSGCYRGFWGTYNGTNYTGTRNTGGLYWNEKLQTFNSPWEGNLRVIKSIRYLGPQDSTVPSISLYETSNMVGRELTIEGPALTNLPFRPNSIFTTARSNWTLFTGDNFSGNVSCYLSTAEYHRIETLNSSFLIGSVLRGCLSSRIDTYIYAKDLEINNSD